MTPGMIALGPAAQELEKRASLSDPFFLAKYICGRHWLKGEAAGKRNLWGPWHADLMQWLWNLWITRYERPYKTFAVVCWPRRTMKSTVCTGPFPIEVLLHAPDTRILFDSQDETSSFGFLQPVKQVFEDKLFQEIHGDLRARGNWNQDSITIKRDAILPQASIMLGSAESSPTGQHWELIIADDLQTEKNVKEPDQRKKIIDRVKMYDNLLDQSGMAVIIGTRWDSNDLMNFLEMSGAEDARYSRPQRIFFNKKSAYKRQADGKLSTTELEFPGLLTEDELAFARSQMGRELFYCNYLCEPFQSDNAQFLKEWIRYHDLSQAQLPEGTVVYMAVDPAGEGKFRDADFNAITVAAVTTTNDTYVLYSWRGHVTRLGLLQKILQLWSSYHPRSLGVEAVFGQHELKAWMKEEIRKRGVVVNWHNFKNSTLAKAARIKVLLPLFEDGKVFIRNEHIELENELLSWPDAGHDDMLDTLAYIRDMVDIPFDAPDMGKWWEQKDWATPDAKIKFIPTAAMPEPPDSGSIAVWEHEKFMKEYKTQHRVRRFTPTSRHL